MTKDQLTKIAKYATAKAIDAFYPHLDKYMRQFGITGRLREAAFIAQILHESGSFRYTKEIASGKAYEGRKDLGNINPGDGVRFKGRGLIQITGRANYAQLGKELGFDFLKLPEALEEADMATMSACWWWDNRKLNTYADTGDFKRITRIINGGTNGLEERTKFYNLALSVL